MLKASFQVKEIPSLGIGGRGWVLLLRIKQAGLNSSMTEKRLCVWGSEPTEEQLTFSMQIAMESLKAFSDLPQQKFSVAADIMPTEYMNAEL